jgi:tetratricopeptide (TPR) repeat protein
MADAADGRLDEHSLVAAALIVCGVNDRRELRRYEARFDDLARRLARSETLDGDDRQRARAVFELLHRELLTGGYDLQCTDLRTVFDQHRFNCVSATLLFDALAERFGLDVCGLEVPGHAMSRVFLGRQTLDVETTCPRWFSLADDPAGQAAHLEATLGRHAGVDRSSAREVSPVELLAMIYYNRGVDFLADQQFAAAAAANAKALRLDPASTTARGNLLATINNWAIALGTAGRHAEAAELLTRGMAIDPEYATFLPNFVHVHHQWVEALLAGGRFQEAVDVLLAAAAGYPAEPYFRRGPIEVYCRWARTRIDAGQPERAFATLDLARRRLGDSLELCEAETRELNAWGLELVAKKRFEAAVDIYDRALARHPASDLLLANRQLALTRRAEAGQARPAMAAEPSPRRAVPAPVAASAGG